MIDCYLALGGNQPRTFSTMTAALFALESHPAISSLRSSPLYHTSPVSPLPQPPYLNAAASFQTTLPLSSLWDLLSSLETTLGKLPKPQEAPRLIDLDLLFYGNHTLTSPITIPHPRWHERLFVLTPLADLTDTLPIPSPPLSHLLSTFSNPHRETVTLSTLTLPFTP